MTAPAPVRAYLKPKKKDLVFGKTLFDRDVESWVKDPKKESSILKSRARRLGPYPQDEWYVQVELVDCNSI